MTKWLAVGAIVITSATMAVRSSAQPGANPPDGVYQAIRINDLARLKALATSPEAANSRDPFAGTPLMSAAIAGSVEAMTLLIGNGADVNAQNTFGTTALMMSATQPDKVRLLLARGAKVDIASKQGRTALFIAAMSANSAPIVRLLTAGGANISAKDAFGNTVLTAAAYGNDLDTLRLCLDAGVDVNAVGVTGATPLLGAAYNGNLAAVRLLLAKGARVNTVSATPTLFPAGGPKSGPVAISEITPLTVAAAGAPTALIEALLDAGANVNAREGRGMTPLMLAVATNHQNAATIRLLLARGADATVQSKAGETASDWARKLGQPIALELLKIPASPLPPAAAAHAAAAPAAVKAGAERGLALLEISSQKFFETSGCVSCHHQNAAGMAAGEARARGLRFDAAASVARAEMLKQGPPLPLLLERMDINVPEIFASALNALAAEQVPANPVTDMIVANIAATQGADGAWLSQNGSGDRPPTEEGAISRAAMCVRSLIAYGAPARAADLSARIARARQWLLAATPVTSEDRNMQILGLHWAGADAASLKTLADAVLAQQRRDGAWGQHDGVPADAYATGQSLYVLAKAGALAPTDPAYQRGVSYLLATQNENGSWRVASRAPKFQAYFNSGFPYAGDQWISAWATGWASMALAQAVPPPARTAAGQ